MKVLHCHRCRESWEFDPPLGRRDDCPKCGADARVCLNCVYYDAASHHECREPQAEWVRHKDEANFCSYFSPSGQALAPSSGVDRRKLDALFGSGEEKEEGGREGSGPPTSLEDLFKK